MSGGVRSERGTSGRMDAWLSEETHDAIDTLLKEPLSDAEIARRLGIADQTVWRHRRDKEIPSYRERMAA